MSPLVYLPVPGECPYRSQVVSLVAPIDENLSLDCKFLEDKVSVLSTFVFPSAPSSVLYYKTHRNCWKLVFVFYVFPQRIVSSSCLALSHCKSPPCLLTTHPSPSHDSSVPFPLTSAVEVGKKSTTLILEMAAYFLDFQLSSFSIFLSLGKITNVCVSTFFSWKPILYGGIPTGWITFKVRYLQVWRIKIRMLLGCRALFCLPQAGRTLDA